MVAVDAYPFFLAFLYLTCHLEDAVFSGCTVLLNSKETDLESSEQEALPSAKENTGVVLVPCFAWKYVPTVICGGVDISEVPGCHLLSEGHKNYFKDWCLMNSHPTFLVFTNFNSMNYGHIIKGM